MKEEKQQKLSSLNPALTVSQERLERVAGLDPSQLRRVYLQVFTSPEGQMVLEDLKLRFFEYVPPPSMEGVGSQKVIIHIKNMVIFDINEIPEISPATNNERN